jgi:hypothetical protein
LRSTKSAQESLFCGITHCETTTSKEALRGTQILTFPQHEIPADFCDEAAAAVRGIEMRELLTSCSHHARFRLQVRGEFENHALCCQDFSAKTPNIFP